MTIDAMIPQDSVFSLNPEHEIVKRYLESGTWKKAGIHRQMGKRVVFTVLQYHMNHCVFETNSKHDIIVKKIEHEIVKEYLESGSWKKIGIHQVEGKRAVQKVLRFHMVHCLNIDILIISKKTNQRIRRIAHEVLWKCPVCGKEMMLLPHKAKARKYCSFQCFKSVPKRRKPRSEKRSFRISPEWRRARKKCISKFGHICPVSFKSEPIEVHHIDFDWLNNEPENLIPLWAPLHRLITARGEVSSFYETLDRAVLLSIIRAWKQ